jgi:hypothetical protein
MLSQERVDVEIARRRESTRQWAFGTLEMVQTALALLGDDEGTHAVAGALDEASRHLDAARMHLAQAETLETVRHAR